MGKCICAEYDGRGLSCCGAPCPIHPPEGQCAGCATATHGDVLCFRCHAKELQARKTKTQLELDAAYARSIEVMHTVERLVPRGVMLPRADWLDPEAESRAREVATDARKVFEGMCDLIQHYSRLRPEEYIWE
jgi:hypothetical protein